MFSHLAPALHRRLIRLARACALPRARAAANFGNFRAVVALLALILAAPGFAEQILLKPARVFDGLNRQPHEGWSVLVDGDRISALGPDIDPPAGARVINLPGATLM